MLVTVVFESGLIPDYFVVRELGMLNTYWPVIFYRLVNAWYLIILTVADFRDTAALEAHAREARAHGFDGASCVHPSGVAALNRAFAPSAEEVAWAERIIVAAKSAERGAFALDGRMIDAPVIRRARRILDQAAPA